MMSRSRVEGWSYGQRTPPLTSLLKSILERYPDGGQILKEIIQNADDAEATKVSFLLDSRQEPYGTSTLYRDNNDLAKFQGPALYAFNNALFKEEDWEGLQSLMRSKKKEDPLKVGRFGIGFNSIYHVTDLPSLVSGDLLAFLDPHEVYFERGETGKQFSLKQKLLADYHDQFAPFEDVLDCKISSEFVDGTLFRFPLRSQTSKLSDKAYSADKVRNLFMSLKEEATLILLFLKNIEEINLYETTETQKERLVFRVRLHESCREDVRTKRKHFLSQVPEWESGHKAVLELTLKMDIDIFDENTNTRNVSWITHNRISGLQEKAEKLHLLPWIGFAAPLLTGGQQFTGSDSGRIFCFLPLPPDADAQTGYPIHIHGYFGLTDNRRGLKWPGPECQNDDMAEWNKLLLKHVGSRAYASLLEAMTYHLAGHTNMENIFYQCWPNVSHIRNHWKDIIQPMMLCLVDSKVFWTEGSVKGQWIHLQSAIVDRLNAVALAAHTKETVLKVLHLANEPVVSLPMHVLTLVDIYMRAEMSPRDLTPTYFRSILKKSQQNSWDIAKMDRKEKIAMLEYMISDNMFADFVGIALLPLADGRFTTFQRGNCGERDRVYVETPGNHMSLLPGMKSRFLDNTINANVLLSLSGKATERNQIKQSVLQLVRLNQDAVITLLKKVLPSRLFNQPDPVPWNGYNPPGDWFPEIWNWLVIKFPRDLSRLEGFPLILCPMVSRGQALSKLVKQTRIIRQVGTNNSTSLPGNVVSLLNKANVIVLQQVPNHMNNHPCFGIYVADATPQGVLQVLQNTGLQRSVAAVNSSSAQEKKSLREYLCRCPLTNKQKEFLKSLPIFEAIDGHSFIIAQNTSATAPLGYSQVSVSITRAAEILSIEDPTSRQLLSNLSIPAMTMASFLAQEVFPHLTRYSIPQITTLMCWVLRSMATLRYQHSSFFNTVMELNFVVVRKMLYKPRDLYDPREKITQRLLEGEENKFPIDEFTSDDILVALSSLGLKKAPSAEDLASLVQNLGNHKDDVRNRKAQTLLQFLDLNPSLLDVKVSARNLTLKAFLLPREWVPCVKEPPVSYPACMTWYSVGNRLLKPAEVVDVQHALIAGAVMPLLQSGNHNLSRIKGIFGWNRAPHSSKVVEQLKTACNVQFLQRKEKQAFLLMLVSIYKALPAINVHSYSPYLSQDNVAWIWNGYGFSTPRMTAFETPFNLEPYLFTIPEELKDQELEGLFSAFGVKRCFNEEEVLEVLHKIKEKHACTQSAACIKSDKKLSLEILQWVVRNGPLQEDLRDTVYVPVMSEANALSLVPCNECTFCDAEWLRENFFEFKTLPEYSELKLIHESISAVHAFQLGVPPMSKCLTAPEMLGFEQASPYEPITTRLKNILDDYKEGAGVFKEIIQNADDAGATEVKFLVDWRQHSETKLLDVGMKESQGPALLAYNNAIFTEKDFKNINKLAGATKKEDLEKIGRFGLGFNSVYHFTDTPSFVSSHYAVFFDPHTTHLGKFIMSPSHPGVKLDLAKKKTLLLYPGQFQPYHGVFGCDVSGDNPFNYDGTLFRFPFRRSQSEICDKRYHYDDVNSLLESFQASASTILLNTQNVQYVSVWELDRQASTPDSMELRIEVDRSQISCSSSLQTTFLKDCAEWTRNATSSGNVGGALPQRTNWNSVTHTSKGTPKETDFWLQCDRLGDAESFDMATSKEGIAKGLLSCAGVSAKLTVVDGSLKAQELSGEAFCFLPLSIPTGLPVHVNGYFAVTSNRRGIWEQTTNEHHFQPLEVRWNKKLMSDGITKAYIQLLQNVANLAQKGVLQEYIFSSLWPNPDSLQSQVWMPLISGVYEQIANSSIPLLKSGADWYLVSDCVYPDSELTMIPGSHKILRDLGYKIVDLPEFARRGFKIAGCSEEIENQTLSKKKFLANVFFPNINSISGSLRDEVVCYAIDECLGTNDSAYKNVLCGLIKENACIPCSSVTSLLARPRDLVHPHGAAAPLFLPCDDKMPVGECFRKPKRLLFLKDLGMVKDKMSWPQITERAKSVEKLRYEDGLKRISSLVIYLNGYISKMQKPSEDTKDCFTTLAILPVKTKPVKYEFPWKGDSHPAQTMLPSKTMFDEKYANVIGALYPILDESEDVGCGQLDDKVRELFRLTDYRPSSEAAVMQLKIVCGHFQTQGSIKFPRILSRICTDIYKYLQTHMDSEESLVEKLRSFAWVFVEESFVRSDQLAFAWSGYGAPYLYSVPSSLASSVYKLLQAVGIKQEFAGSDFLRALSQMKEDKMEHPLNESDFKVSKTFLDEVNSALGTLPTDGINCTPMPDHNRVLCPANKLVINDAPWICTSKDVRYVHEDISINLAHALGASDSRSKSLDDISRPIGQPFGQRESLTDRLAGILKSYPFDFGILKELLQNADDAKATEIHFIYDSREHKTERVFSDSWKELQGPALCVYNNQTFSEGDIEGIQKLGIGSKTDSPEKTGQYGIGFNAVYHLTDCPSFISDGNTLCILDPHARYAPHATKENPGRIIGPFDDVQKENYRDVFPGYLGKYFNLQGSTMFRLPLRTVDMARKSAISNKEVLTLIKTLLFNLKDEAKEALLFLNHVKKISISIIENEHQKLVKIYEVSAYLEKRDEQKRREMADYVHTKKHLPTHEIARFDIAYPITIKENLTEEKWIVQQTVGISSRMEGDVPDGKTYGLLPRGGVAAKVRSLKKKPPNHVYSIGTQLFPGKAFCFLPLPVKTGLPVHVNGHFALDSGRRHLWQDEDGKGFRSQWNAFLKNEVIADAYISLLIEARKHIPDLKGGSSSYFNFGYEAHWGLEWYEELIPLHKECDTHWKELVKAVLNRIIQQEIPALPLLREVDSNKKKHSCTWLTPSQGFFKNSLCDYKLTSILLHVGFKLIHLSHQTFDNFKDAGANVKEVSPDEVMMFLSTHEPLLNQLPCPIKNSSIGSLPNVLMLLSYCSKSSDFSKKLQGLPLLLTRENVLRIFSGKNPVYLSTFSNLVQSTSHLERFVGDELVSTLNLVCNELFLQQSPVVQPLKLADLAKFLPSIFPEHKVWAETTNPVPWLPKGDDNKIAKWLTRLWCFIVTTYSESPSDDFLKPLTRWPVIPTTSSHLAPVCLAKSVLDLTRSVSWTPNQSKIVNILRKLRCPEVDMQLISSKREVKVADVVRPYLAYPNSVNDVIIVLDNLMKYEAINGRINADEASLILQFLQEDADTLKTNLGNISVLRRLPFYKTINGRLISLKGASFVYKVPEGIPLEESDVWMEGIKNVFLEPCQTLDLLHSILGVELKSHVSCYIDFILPKFKMLSPATRLKHLIHVKRILLTTQKNPETDSLLKVLETLEFIPNVDTGILCKASDFYDPEMPVFKALLTKDKFPPPPFCKEVWIPFLCQIGLQQAFSENQVLGFAKDIEKQAKMRGATIGLCEKSGILTNYIFDETCLHKHDFFQKISVIKFVVAFKAGSELTSLVGQFSFDKSDSASLTSFRNALSHQHEILVWSSAALLPDCCVPFDQMLRSSLGILEKPTVQQVVKHASNLCGTFSGSTEMDRKMCFRTRLLKIMPKIYNYLCERPLDSQSNQMLRMMPLVLVEDGGVFVQCKQLVFQIHDELPPYLYRVPREYGVFQHLFKNLGAQEKPCPSQYASILEKIRKSTKGADMHAEEMRKAKKAMNGLFEALKRLHKEDSTSNPKTSKCADALKEVQILYLPNQRKQIMPSTQLFHMYDCPTMIARISSETPKYDLLLDLKDCELFDRPGELLSYLPPNLQVTSLKNVLCETLHPECLDKKCRFDEDEQCPQASRLRAILGSKQFTNGIVRILKAQERSATIKEDVRIKVEKLSTMFNVVCFESLETVLKNEKDEEISGSKKGRLFFSEDDGKMVTIFICHGATVISGSLKICGLIYRFLEDELKELSLLYIQCILRLRRPEEILYFLDQENIERDVLAQEAGPELDYRPGTIIPLEQHQLLMQYEDFLFRKGEMVGYEIEDNPDSEQGKYIHAQIIRKILAPDLQGSQKKKKLDPTTGREKKENPLLGRYLIDIGTGTNIEVDVLDLYKLKRPEELEDEEDNHSEDNELSDCQSLVPFEGDAPDHESASTNNLGQSAPRNSHHKNKPRTLEKAIEEVNEALGDIMNLPQDKRRKALKRLYLRWHPDKNPDMEELATEVMQYIQNEFERLSTRGSSRTGNSRKQGNRNFDDDHVWQSWFRNWDQRARQQRSTYDNYRRNRQRSTGDFSSRNSYSSGSGHSGQYYNSFTASSGGGGNGSYHAPDARLARIWLIQSRADLESVTHLFSAKTEEFYWLICFQCNQVVEKALKAALYAVSGISDAQLESHDLIMLASDLKSLPRAPDVLQPAGQLRNYHDPTRYPHKHFPAQPPKEVYTFMQAREAYDIAKDVVKKMEEFVGILHL